MRQHLTKKLEELQGVWMAKMGRCHAEAEAWTRTSDALRSKLMGPDYKPGCASAERAAEKAAGLRHRAALAEEAEAFIAYQAEFARLREMSPAQRQTELAADPYYQQRMSPLRVVP